MVKKTVLDIAVAPALAPALSAAVAWASQPAVEDRTKEPVQKLRKIRCFRRRSTHTAAQLETTCT